MKIKAGSWEVAQYIFIWSFTVFILAAFASYRFDGISIEYVRAFAMWSTMTIGGAGLYIAIQKFGIDFSSHTTKKLACVYKSKRRREIDKTYHIYDLINRSDNDIYVKSFVFFKGDLLKYDTGYKGFTKIWDIDKKTFISRSSKKELGDVNSIMPGNHITIALSFDLGEIIDTKLLISYTTDDYHGNEKTLLVKVKQS